MHIGRPLVLLLPFFIACASPVEGSTSSATPDERPSEPTAADLCEHVMDVTKAEIGESASQPSEQEIDQFLSECAKELVLERQKIGDDEEYFRQARCIMAAQSLAEMAKCDPADAAPEAP
jgi:hypothetical protein